MNEQCNLKNLYRKDGKYKLGDLCFNTKNDLKNYVSQWLKLSSVGYVIGIDDEEWVLCLLSQHPSWIEKSKNMKNIEIGYTRGNNHFSIRKLDGTIDDISYLKCLNGDTDYCKVMKAFRDSIIPQILAFRLSVFRNGPIKCEVSGIVLYNDSNTHIDHNYNILPFISIVKNFLAEKHLNFSDIQTVSVDTLRDFSDPQFKLDWLSYHKQKANLRAISKYSNLHQTK